MAKLTKLKGYYLPHNHRLYYPKWIVFFDTETISDNQNLVKNTRLKQIVNANVQKLRLGFYEIWVKRVRKNPKNGFVIGKVGDKYVVYDKIDEGIFYTAYDFLNNILYKTKSNENVWIFAYNCSFDFRVIYDRGLFNSLGLELKKWIVDSQRFYMKFRRQGEKGSIIFTDVMHFVGGRISLKKLAEKTGLGQKLKTLEKYNYQVDQVPEDELIEYVKVDVEIIREYMLHFLKYIFGLGSFKLTLAGVSFSIFRHSFMKKKIVKIDNPDYLEWVKRAYYGGRTEIFYTKKIEKAYYLDFNSLYPYVMKTFKYPVRLVYLFEASNPQDEIELVRIAKMYINNPKYLVIVEGEFCIPENLRYGILPYRDKKGKVYYLVGKVEGVYAQPEIELMLEKGGKILRVKKLAVYIGDKIFEDFIDYFYQEKKKAKENEDYVSYWNSKIIMNSLYGKFAQRITKYKRMSEFDGLPEGKHVILGTGTEIIVINGKAYIKDKEDFSKYAIPEIAVFVTSYARTVLAKALFKVNAYYCDTDSVVVSERELEKFKDIMGDELGQLKIEKVLINVKFIKPKWYIWESEDGEIHMKLKGLSKKHRLIEEDEQKAIFEHERGIGFRESLRFFAQPTKIPVFFFKQTKKFDKIYDKGKVLPNGYVLPFTLEEIKN